MGIRFKFTLEPKRKILAGIKWNSRTAEHIAREAAKDLGYKTFHFEGYLVIQLCPEGHLWINWNKGKLTGETQTNVAGPGFHAAAIDFLEEFAKKRKLKLTVEDPTGYYNHRDFLAMRQRYFYRWFSELMAVVSEWEGKEEYMFCWPVVYYVPKRLEGKLITHIRYFSFQEIKGMLHSGMTVAFAREFFVWNEAKRDGWFYRNSGLVMLNQSCYFMPSKRSVQDQIVNQSVIRMFEKALSLDRNIPFPKKEYLELCCLDEREPLDLEGVKAMEEGFLVGSRRDIIYRKIGKISFGIPGNFLYDKKYEGNMDHYYDGEDYGGHDYYVYTAIFEGRPSEFKDQWFEQGQVEELLEFELGKARAKAAVYKPGEQEGRKVYSLSAQVIYKDQRMNINITWKTPGEKEWALGLIRNIKVSE